MTQSCFVSWFKLFYVVRKQFRLHQKHLWTEIRPVYGFTMCLPCSKYVLALCVHSYKWSELFYAVVRVCVRADRERTKHGPCTCVVFCSSVPKLVIFSPYNCNHIFFIGFSQSIWYWALALKVLLNCFCLFFFSPQKPLSLQPGVCCISVSKYCNLILSFYQLMKLYKSNI